MLMLYSYLFLFHSSRRFSGGFHTRILYVVPLVSPTLAICVAHCSILDFIHINHEVSRNIISLITHFFRPSLAEIFFWAHYFQTRVIYVLPKKLVKILFWKPWFVAFLKVDRKTFFQFEHLYSLHSNLYWDKTDIDSLSRECTFPSGR
jgi:hypothetical protein